MFIPLTHTSPLSTTQYESTREALPALIDFISVPVNTMLGSKGLGYLVVERCPTVLYVNLTCFHLF